MQFRKGAHGRLAAHASAFLDGRGLSCYSFLGILLRLFSQTALAEHTPPQPIPDAFRERMRNPMQSRMLYKSLIAAAVLLMTFPAFAGEKEKIETRQTMTVNGNQLPAGKYTVTWEGNGPSVELKFVQAGKVVVTAAAQLVTQKTESVGAVLTQNTNDGVVLTEIQPIGKKYTLTIGKGAVETTAENNGK